MTGERLARGGPDPAVDGARAWVPAAAWAAVILLATSVPVPEAGPPGPVPHVDKLVHLALYGVLGWLLAPGLHLTGRPGRGALAAALVGAALFAGVDEWHQTWLASRHPEALDWAADVVGATGGAALRRGAVGGKGEARPERGGAAPRGEARGDDGGEGRRQEEVSR